MRPARGGRPDDFDRLIELTHALQHVNKSAEAKLGLSVVQFHLLRELLDLPGSPSQLLAERAGIHASTLTQSIRRLGRKGYLHVALDPRDSRRKLLTVTRAGRDAVARFVTSSRAHLGQAVRAHPILALWLEGGGRSRT